MLGYLNAKQTTTEVWNITKCDGYESTKNCLDDTWLNPKCYDIIDNQQ